jgi:hypothetical protein
MDAADGAAGLVEMVNGGRAISAAPPHKITIYGWSIRTYKKVKDAFTVL